MIGEQPSHQRSLQAYLGRDRQFACADPRMFVAFHGVRDVDQRSVGALESLNQEVDPVFLDPDLNQGEQLLFAELLCSNAECFFGNGLEVFCLGRLLGTVFIV